MKNSFRKNKHDIIQQHSWFATVEQVTKKGFTLVELLVVIAIIAIISSLALFNSSKLNSAVLISNTAYEIGLVIRDAQVSGLGAKVTSASGDISATTSNQGIYFSLNPQKIISFADLIKDNTYNEGEESQIYNIENKRAGTITKICTIQPTTNTCTQLSELTIVFKRPNPEAYFYPDASSANPHIGSGFNGTVAINVGFEGGDCRSIIIYKTGAVQIDRSYCDPVIN
ncbi:prepilin-type N-terminal cleavage/methylation domain-containing protein [Arenimonas sp.]|nr:prepilin-type N-terminal cleavage/methylation domain-containing protein [Candidatus Parcubacteria bacterium]